MRILNLYAGIGGNRKLWGDIDVTAIEYNHDIAKIYKDFFPKDKVVVADAHEFLLDHYGKFDFIWSSPPCPTHSKMALMNHLNPYKSNINLKKRGGWVKPRYPDMRLYQEILLLKHFFKGKYCVENVKSYYDPLISCHLIGRNYFWSNFHIRHMTTKPLGISGKKNKGIGHLEKIHEIKINSYGLNRKQKETILRNCVNKYLGLHILNESKRDIQPELFR